MNYRPLGKAGVKISEIGFGCMSLGKNSVAESVGLIQKAFDLGINYFDTADIYDTGNNEQLVGSALKSHRPKVVIATKVGNVIKSDGGKGFDWNPSKEHILKSVEGSLKRLQTDYIDLYQLHGGTIDDPIDETIEAFEILKQQGKILNYGISSIRPNVIKEYVKRSGIVSVMMQYSLLDRRPEEEITDLLYRNDISILARGALAQGILINKSAKDYAGLTADEVKAVKQKIQKMAGSNATEDIALGYLLVQPVVGSVVVGFRTAEQLQAALKTRPDEAMINTIKSRAPVSFYKEHR